MTKMNEWDPVFDEKGNPLKPGELVDTIYRQLMSMASGPPSAVHFYLGEGLRWIRVGFGGEGAGPLEPSAVREVGKTIEPLIPAKPLFFHALRPHDLLFFLEGGKEKSIGMPADAFGAPLDDVLEAWGI